MRYRPVPFWHGLCIQRFEMSEAFETRNQKIRFDKHSTVDRLASDVAHEVNNPLQSVMGCLKALRDEKVPANRRHEYFETARQGLERIRGVVNDLLEFSRASQQKKPPHV